MTDSPFTEKQIAILNAPLDPRFVSERVGGGNAKLKYIEGHDAIDQADRIFGFGNWSYRPLSCNQVVLLDPLTSEAVGVVYKAQVELIVTGCAPIVDVGSQPVATWNVEDYVMKQRQNAVKYGKATTLDEGPFTSAEKYKARDAIVSAHEMAEKGSVTDALKRALRVFGEQFGNGLYGDGRVDIDDSRVTKERLNALYAKGKKAGLFANTGEFIVFAQITLGLDILADLKTLTDVQAGDIDAEIVRRTTQQAS
jgi:hypothetical protein